MNTRGDAQETAGTLSIPQSLGHSCHTDLASGSLCSLLCQRKVESLSLRRLQSAAACWCCRYGGRGCFPEFTNPYMHPLLPPLHQTCPAPGLFCTRSVLHPVYPAQSLCCTQSTPHQVYLVSTLPCTQSTFHSVYLAPCTSVSCTRCF